jgi:hypothetical protein
MSIWRDFYAIGFLKKRVTLVQICRSFGNKKNWKLDANNFIMKLIFNFFGNSHLTHMKVESQVVYANELLGRNTINLGDFKPFGYKNSWMLVYNHGKVECTRLVLSSFSVLFFFIGKHPFPKIKGDEIFQH